MKTPLDLKFKNFHDNGEIKQIIDEKVEKLDRLHNQIISCHVLIEQIQHEQHSGHSYHVRITVNIPPHHEIIVKRDPEKGEIGTEHLSTIVRDAFDATCRNVKKIADRQHKKIKAHSKNQDTLPASDAQDKEDLVLES